MVEPVALGALGLDAALGWPARVHARIGHPVGGFARIIAFCERRWNSRHCSNYVRRAGGIATVLLLLAAAVGCSYAAEKLIRWSLGQWAWAGMAFAAWPALAQRSLYQHVLAVARELDAGRLSEARRAVGWIVGRDTASLDEAGVARAAVESLAESFCDGVTAPLFWLLLGGLPGIWAYKAVNTADSLIGHREEPYGPFGWAAARLDDVMNLVPARLAALLICLAGQGGWRVMWRDHGRHASPNAGWPEAAMAGALDVRLGGPLRYDGVLNDKPWIGEGGRHIRAADVRRAMRIFLRACALLWVLAALWELSL
ncbi:Cobalamin biosynthesis protein CobD [Sphingomonas paucimobilis]|nr:Cobalamin biosynthesis protein CobD [Sphingomonas paucimobilis]